MPPTVEQDEEAKKKEEEEKMAKMKAAHAEAQERAQPELAGDHRRVLLRHGRRDPVAAHTRPVSSATRLSVIGAWGSDVRLSPIPLQFGVKMSHKVT